MKSVLIALLLVAIVLLVGSEARRFGGKGKQGGRPGGKPWLKSEFMSVKRHIYTWHTSS